ncbi:MAG: helix-turn-helix transcriptional regulator [Roseburia sp.]|nr:helix-turn-helix transcriptional regulator [Roseburia sp.]
MDLSYQNFNRMVMNETTSIKFENLDKLCQILQCPIGDLFEVVNDEY